MFVQIRIFMNIISKMELRKKIVLSSKCCREYYTLDVLCAFSCYELPTHFIF